ncbi:CNT_collapsed_G0015770.mRNA.1.CDS.1 [Saccharomyces cerevisiae]|nr:CNT_collapsed_G0015770.mRNA.1.CDS.1 [Saccharomyces cerevisiae]
MSTNERAIQGRKYHGVAARSKQGVGPKTWPFYPPQLTGGAKFLTYRDCSYPVPITDYKVVEFSTPIYVTLISTKLPKDLSHKYNLHHVSHTWV